jgi:hypothetical protein
MSMGPLPPPGSGRASDGLVALGARYSGRVLLRVRMDEGDVGVAALSHDVLTRAADYAFLAHPDLCAFSKESIIPSN